MSGTFAGVFNSRKTENHVFISEDGLLVAMNLASFSKNSCYEIYNKLLPSLSTAFPQIPYLMSGGNKLPPFQQQQTILDLDGALLQAYYQKFNRDTKRYDRAKTLLTLQQIYNLIEYHDNVQNRKNATRNPEFDDQITEIRNSLSGCIKIYADRETILPQSPIGSGDILIKLFFQGRAQRDNSRVMTLKSAPMITDVGKTPAGTNFGVKKTNDFATEDPSNIGSKLPPSEDGVDNPQNTITAKLKMSYNSSDGTWESGTTQVLAKLLADLPAADINNVVPPSNMAGLSNDDFFDPDGAYNMSQFTVGSAMPLTMENGNPHTFGPNIIECEEKKLEKVRAINRSAVSFSAGEVVMLTRLGSEWVVSSLGTATLQDKAVGVTDWKFARYVVNSDAFFKDERYYSSDQTTFSQYSQTITPFIYESAARHRFYNLNDDSYNAYYEIFKLDDEDDVYTAKIKLIAEINFNLTPSIFGSKKYRSLIPSNRYVIASVFDQMNHRHGGFLIDDIFKVSTADSSQRDDDGNIIYAGGKSIGVINPFDQSIDNFSLLEDIFPFWGVVFSDGYRRVKNGFNKEDNFNSKDSLYFNRSDIDDNNVSLSEFDNNNIPAEATSKIIDSTSLNNFFNAIGTKSVNQSRNISLYPPYYESEAINQRRISFLPLTDTLIGSLDPFSQFTASNGSDGKFWDQARFVMSGGSYGSSIDQPQALWGLKILERNDESYLSIPNIRTDHPSCLDTYGQGGVIPNLTSYFVDQKPFIRYDCFIKRPSTSVPLGAPRYFRDSGAYLGANLVGVIAGSCTVAKLGGGEINFLTRNQFGLKPDPTDIVGDIGVPGWVGVLIPGIDSGGISRRDPMWGSSSDNYYDFGTTAIHARVFDYWPEEDTFYDPRYFAVLHFNPHGKKTFFDNDNLSYVEEGTENSFTDESEDIGSPAKYEEKGLSREELEEKFEGKINNIGGLFLRVQGDSNEYIQELESNGEVILNYSNRPRLVDVQETSVDIRVPTWDTAVNQRTLGSYGIFVDRGILAKDGDKIYHNSALRPSLEWRIDTIRRGQLLTGGGFYYNISTIGLDKNSVYYVDRGSGFTKDQEIELPRGITIKITQINEDGGIEDFEFQNSSSELCDILDVEFIESLGRDFEPFDFSNDSAEREALDEDDNEITYQVKCYSLTVTNSNENGSNAVLEFENGIVWSEKRIDYGPVEYSSITRLSLDSKQGQDRSEGNFQTSIPVEANESGKYSMFTLFHNDITHTPGTARAGSIVPGFLQYIDMTIS